MTKCYKCGRTLKPGESGDDWFITGAESADGKPETWDMCPECERAYRKSINKCPTCGASLVDGYIENMPAFVCPNDCDYGIPA